MMKMMSSYSKKTPPTVAAAAIARTPLVDTSSMVGGVANKSRQQSTTNQRQTPATNQQQRPSATNQQRPLATNQNQPPSSLADHRYQQRCGQIDFLSADAVVGSAYLSSSVIGRNRRPINSGNDTILVIDAATAAADSPAAAEISPIFSLASPTNQQIFDIKNCVNFFTEYETSAACEPISPAALPIPIPAPRAATASTLHHHQSSFDFTPPRIDFPLYTAPSNASLSDSGGSFGNSLSAPNNNNRYSELGPNNGSYLSPGPNNNYSPSSESRNFNTYYAIDSDSSSSSSSPVWQDQFLNINELLPQHVNFAAFNDPIFGQSSFDDLLLSIAHEHQQQQENHHVTVDQSSSATLPPTILPRKSSYDNDHVTSPTLYGGGGHVIIHEEERRGGPIVVAIEGGGGSPASSHSSIVADQSYFPIATRRSITIQEGAEAELKKSPPLSNNNLGVGGFDQSAMTMANFKNQQEILEEIYRECEKHVKIFRPETEIDQSAQTSATMIMHQPIIHLDLDEDSGDVTTPPPPAPAATTIFPLVEREIRSSSRDYDDQQPPIKKQRSKQHQQKLRFDENSTISSASYSPVIADWLSEDDDDDEEMDDIPRNGDQTLLGDEVEYRKRRQNRKAASKYRTKRKIEKISIESERAQLEAENRRLRSIVDDRQREIDYLRNFLDEIRASKSKMGRN